MDEKMNHEGLPEEETGASPWAALDPLPPEAPGEGDGPDPEKDAARQAELRLAFDALRADETLPREEALAVTETQTPPPPVRPDAPREKLRWPKLLLRVLTVLLVTALMVCALAYGAILVICKGPSPTARDLFVRSVRETSAIGFLADLVLSPEEIAAIEQPVPTAAPEETDVSLLRSADGLPSAGEELVTDAWGYCDEDGDGLILVDVKGESYMGYMLIVLDPSRVILGCIPETLGYRGYTVEEFVKHYDAVAGINGGGFDDPNGQGNGSMPSTLLVRDGQIYCGYNGIGNGFVGIDDEGNLRVGFQSSQDVKDWHIKEGCGYGPILVVNGEARDEESLSSGLNPRTAIGQRSDKAILMLVIEGRQPNRLGATYLDVAEVMLSFGAMNACNLDGGSSSMMWYQDKYLNNTASVIGIRPIPTSFLVLKQEVSEGD